MPYHAETYSKENKKEIENDGRYKKQHREIRRLSIAEGLIAVNCNALDCVFNDKSLFDKNQTGFCNLDTLFYDSKRGCQNYKKDFLFLKTYTVNSSGEWVTFTQFYNDSRLESKKKNKWGIK